MEMKIKLPVQHPKHWATDSAKESHPLRRWHISLSRPVQLSSNTIVTDPAYTFIMELKKFNCSR